MPLDGIYRLWIAPPEGYHPLVEYYVCFGVTSGNFEVDSQAVFAHLRQTPSTPNAARPLDVRQTPLREAAANFSHGISYHYNFNSNIIGLIAAPGPARCQFQGRDLWAARFALLMSAILQQPPLGGAEGAGFWIASPW